jgi:hypothetical protein
MSIKSKVFAVAATITMVGGVSAAGLVHADASTGSCVNNCLNVYGEEYGDSPGFVLDVFRQTENIGQPLILFRASNTDPAEDFIILDKGTVRHDFRYGMVSTQVFHRYTNYEAYEVEYAPYGVDSGLCMGVASTPVDNTPVALETCGASPMTTWVVDAPVPDLVFYPWINGAQTNSTNPYVLRYPANAYPTDIPRMQLNTYALQHYTDGTFPTNVYSNEMWAGLDPAAPLT